MKNVFFNTLLLILGLAITLVLSEVILRVVGFTNPSLYTVDPDLGSALRPNAEGLYQREGRAYITINSDGLRDVEHIVAKPSDVFRIAVLGDSYTEGLHVDLDKLYWKIAEKGLNECQSVKKRVEFINFGVSGFGTGRELLMLQKKVWRYQPDAVVLGFLTSNDIRENNKIINRVDYVPYFFLDDKGEIQVDKSFLISKGYQKRKGLLTSTLFQYGHEFRLFQFVYNLKHVMKLLEKETIQHQLNLETFIYHPPKSKDWQEAWNITEHLLLQIRKEVEEQGAQFFLVTLSNGNQVSPIKEEKEEYIKQNKIESIFYPDMRIRDFAIDNAINVLTLAPDLAKIAEEKNIFMHGFENSALGTGHWNANGHRYAGEILTKYLCSKLQ